jgi:glycosyltransferase involved in cell wall biosynthesis
MQTFEQWECIVVNDTAESLEEHVPPWVTLATTLADHGPAHARNIGLGLAKGKYIYFLDADDYMQPKTLELLIQAVGLGKRYAYSDWIDQDGNVYTTPDCACKDLAAKCPIPVSVLYPKAADIRFDENLQQWEDWDFLLSLETAGYTGVRVDKPLLRYRLNKGLRRRSADPASVLEIKEKWGEINLACGACGQPRSVMLASSQPPLDGNWVLLDYVSPQQGTRTYRAPSNTIYRFGTDSSHRTKRVRQEDVNYLLSLGVFQLHEDLVPA